jgi:Ca-activated chloride channel family protein
MNTIYFNIHWAGLDNLHYLPLLIGALLLIGYRIYRLNYAYALLAARPWRHLLIGHTSLSRSVIKSCLLAVGMIFLFGALLRPQWDKKEQIVEQEGRDLLIALDVSRSMLAQDVDPNRLEFAKQKIRQLVQSLSCERVGLILFSGSTFMHCPLTKDYGAFFMFLDHIDAETISAGTTALDQAIGLALKTYSSMADRKNKLLVLFTDGEDFSVNLTGIKERAREQGLNICAVGIGTAQGAPVPVVDAHGRQIGHQKDDKGTIIISRLNETMLAHLAQEAGGTYVHATNDANDINAIVSYIEKKEKEKFEDLKISSYEEQYPYFLMVSFACFLLEWII